MSAAKNEKNITIVLWLAKRDIGGWVLKCTLVTAVFRRQRDYKFKANITHTKRAHPRGKKELLLLPQEFMPKRIEH